VRELLSHARSVLWMCPLIGVATVFMGTVSMFSSIFDSTGKLQHKVAVAWAKMLLKICLVRVDVIGTQRLDPNQAYVFCSNHFSLIDTPLMFSSTPRPFRILARHRLWRIPFLGWHLGRAGHLPVNRENPREAVKNIQDAADKIRSGTTILLFPEGGRRDGTNARPFKPGAAHIAIRAGVPIVPVAIVGTSKILPRGCSHLRPGRAELRIGDPISTDALTKSDGKDLIRRVQETVDQIWTAGSWN
jgi:1-acyl-sn-glycerol-3-phosphate acyltransferase